jgi:hypothetical protein
MGLTVDDLKKRPLLAKQLVAQHTLLGDNGACRRAVGTCLTGSSMDICKHSAPTHPAHAPSSVNRTGTGLHRANTASPCCDQTHLPDCHSSCLLLLASASRVLWPAVREQEIFAKGDSRKVSTMASEEFRGECVICDV